MVGNMCWWSGAKGYNSYVISNFLQIWIARARNIIYKNLASITFILVSGQEQTLHQAITVIDKHLIQCSISVGIYQHTDAGWCIHTSVDYINGLLQDCSNSSALAMELLQSCTKPSISSSFQTMACHLFSTKPLSETMLTHCSLDPPGAKFNEILK